MNSQSQETVGCIRHLISTISVNSSIRHHPNRMPPHGRSILSKLATGLSIAVGLYGVVLGLLLTPPIQRFALYAHKINTLFLGDDLDNSEAFGFAMNQVTPFNLRTSDGATLYGWHVLPIDVYARHERELREEDRLHGPVSADGFTHTSAFRHLTSTDEPTPARVVLSCTSSPPSSHTLP